MRNKPIPNSLWRAYQKWLGYYLLSIHKWSFCPISVLCEKNNPRNIKHMLVVIFFACLDLEQKSLFMDGHYPGFWWKHNFFPVRKESLPHFIRKLQEKKQTKGSFKNNLVEFAPEFAVDLIDLITQIHRNSELFRGLLRMKIG